MKKPCDPMLAKTLLPFAIAHEEAEITRTVLLTSSQWQPKTPLRNIS